MITIGLTGSIGMGKSATSAMFARSGVPVFDADRAVHVLYAGRAAPVIEAAFPGVVQDGKVDRQKLSAQVVGNPPEISKLEKLIHPMVHEERVAFVAAAKSARHSFIVFDIPLLFETGGQKRVDITVVVSTDAQTQRQRVLERPDMSEDKLNAILAKQMPDEEKRRRAHFIVDSSHGFAYAERQVKQILRAIRPLVGKAGI